MLTLGIVPFYPAKGLRCNAQVRSNVFLRNMLLNIWKIPDQFLIAFHRSEVLQIPRSLATVFIVLIHDDAINEIGFRECLKQIKHTS